MNQPESLIKSLASSLSLDACGIAPVLPDEALAARLLAAGPVPFTPADITARQRADALLPGARAAIVCLFPYGIGKEEEGNLALYARPRDYHVVNRRYLEKLSAALAEKFPDEKFLPLVDTSPLVDRYLAYRAGLGFFGKNHCLIHPKYGSFFTIGSLLTTLPLAADAPLRSRCGDCTRCLAACPGQALSVRGMDPYRCKSYLTQKKEPLTREEEEILARTPLIFGCDECQRACPFNETAAPSPLPEIYEARVPYLSKETLETLSVRAFEREYKAYAFSWRGKKVLLRNAEIVLSPKF